MVYSSILLYSSSFSNHSVRVEFVTDFIFLSLLLAVVMVQFAPYSYTVTEGGTSELTISLSVPFSGPVTVNLATMDDSATGTDWWLRLLTGMHKAAKGNRGDCWFDV